MGADREMFAGYCAARHHRARRAGHFEERSSRRAKHELFPRLTNACALRADADLQGGWDHPLSYIDRLMGHVMPPGPPATATAASIPPAMPGPAIIVAG